MTHTQNDDVPDATVPDANVPDDDVRTCSHLDQVYPVQPSAQGCEDCLRIGGWWVHLRLCLRCGHVGCCDNSPNRHATGHFRASQHPIIRSFEQGEEWGYCYPDDLFFEEAPRPAGA